MQNRGFACGEDGVGPHPFMTLMQADVASNGDLQKGRRFDQA